MGSSTNGYLALIFYVPIKNAALYGDLLAAMTSVQILKLKKTQLLYECYY